MDSPKACHASWERSFVSSFSVDSINTKCRYLQHQTSFGSFYDELGIVQWIQSFETPFLDMFALFLKTLIVDEVFSLMMLIATSANPQLMNLAVWAVPNPRFQTFILLTMIS
eukprot:UN24562